MTAAEASQLLTIEQYLEGELRSDVRHEYLGGYVYAMAGARTQHNRIATNFTVALGSALRDQPCEPFNSDMKVRVQLASHTRFYYPDAMVVCTPNAPDEPFQDQPVVVAEVLSAETRRIDEGEKREAYCAIPSLRVYLLIEQDLPRVVAYRRGEQGFTREVYDGPDAVFPLAEIDADLPLAELYRRVDFAPTADC
ncbi:MAG: hypothetical protein CMJ58_23290 [Planctomycetaceae bacterium]|nr:hypothetical protein [Planctomycetaceae bacterium]